jgi:hypothetical protein
MALVGIKISRKQEQSGKDLARDASGHVRPLDSNGV